MLPRKAGRTASMPASSGRASVVFDHLAVGIVRISRLAEAQREAVALGAVHDIGHGFSGGTESDRKQACRQRIERAAMTGLLGVEKAFQLVDHVGAGRALRLIENEPPVQGAAAPAAFHHGLCDRCV